MIGKLQAVVLDAPDISKLASFYSTLTGWTQADANDANDDWITLKSADGWQIDFQLALDHVPPRWPDPEYPQQFHIDIRVPDIDAAADRAVELGAVRLGGGPSWTTLADPAGHPFDLCKNDEDPAFSIFAVTIDTDEPKELGRFYADLLGMEIRYDGDEGSLIGADGQGSLMFQRIEQHVRPQWPDPAHPQQFHLDISVDNIEEAEVAVLALGATRLEGGGKTFRPYADPSGHPFCLCW